MNIKAVIISIGAIITIFSSFNFNNEYKQLNNIENVQQEISVRVVGDIDNKIPDQKAEENISFSEETEAIENEIVVTKTKEEITKKKTENKATKEKNEQSHKKQQSVDQDIEKQVETKQENKVQEEIKIQENKIAEVIEKEPEIPKCTDSKHGVGVGNSNKWFSTYDEAVHYYNNLINYYSNNIHNGLITTEEYYSKCPYGYETWSCQYCGKWTLNYYFR